MRCLIIKIKNEMIYKVQKDNEKNIKYQRRTRFMFEGTKNYFGKNHEENNEKSNKKENLINENDVKHLNKKIKK